MEVITTFLVSQDTICQAQGKYISSLVEVLLVVWRICTQLSLFSFLNICTKDLKQKPHSFLSKQIFQWLFQAKIWKLFSLRGCQILIGCAIISPINSLFAIISTARLIFTFSWNVQGTLWENGMSWWETKKRQDQRVLFFGKWF